MRNPFKRPTDPPASQQTLGFPEPDAAPGADRPSTSRALQAGGVRAVSRVAVEPTPVESEPAAGHAGFTQGVVLTQTERVRLRIMQAQLRLSGLLLYEGPIDGMLNLDTVAALRYFQTLKGLRESGQATAATLRALGVPSGP